MNLFIASNPAEANVPCEPEAVHTCTLRCCSQVIQRFVLYFMQTPIRFRHDHPMVHSHNAEAGKLAPCCTADVPSTINVYSVLDPAWGKAFPRIQVRRVTGAVLL
jgi:hypothetical protein